MAPQTPEKKAKVYMLGDFMKGREKVIEDPYDVSAQPLPLRMQCRRTGGAVKKRVEQQHFRQAHIMLL